MSETNWCTVKGCTRKLRARGYCDGHYLRWRRTGEPGPATFRVIDASRTCNVGECNRPYQSNGMCGAHYQQASQGKAPGAIRNPRGSSALRDEHGRKWCSSGEHWVSPDEFPSSKDTADGLMRRCAACLKLSKFKMTLAQYNELLSTQGGGCAICGGVNPNGTALAVDHDHTCCPGKRSCGRCTRGLLCGTCNTGIGMMGDSQQRLRDAADYLSSFSGPS